MHKIISDFLKISIVADGQNVESLKQPYIVYSFLQERRYREDQTLTVPIETSGELGVSKKIPCETEIQYKLSGDSKKIRESRDLARKFYNFLTTDFFKSAIMRLDGIGFTIISGLREILINRADFFERQFNFDVRWLWADFIVDPQSDTIESAEATQIPPDEGQ